MHRRRRLQAKRIPPVRILRQSAAVRGKLIVFEGIDGTGKSTQVERLAARLSAAGEEVETSFEPTKGQYGQRLRASMVTGRLSADEELGLFHADRRDHVERLIEPSLAAGKYVLLDRYYFSTMAYQGARGFDPAELKRTNESFAPVPDVLLIFELPVDDALARIGVRDGEGNAFEKRECLQSCARIFAEIDGDYVHRIDASQDADAVEDQVAAAVAMGLSAGINS